MGHQKRYQRWFLLGIVAIAAGCGGSSGGGLSGTGGAAGTGGGSNGSGTCGNNTTVSFNEPCASCLATNCNSVISACYGPNWQSLNFGGTCASLLSCACSCGNGNQACFNNCQGQESQACLSCRNDVNLCQVQHCEAQCTNAGP